MKNMFKIKYVLAVTFLSLFSFSGFSQKAERDNIRKGNKQYGQDKYTEAEIDYRKSLEFNPNSVDAAFNLGNALFRQEKYEDALKQYSNAAQNAAEEQVVSEALHNIGNALMGVGNYEKAIEAYKQSLRINPSDFETKYNLAYAQKMKKEEEEKKEEQKEDKQDQDQNKDQQDQDKKDQQDQQNQDQQNQDQNQDQQQQQEQQQGSDQISQEMAEQILNALEQDEKDVQEKVQKAKMQQMKQRKTDKDW